MNTRIKYFLVYFALSIVFTSVAAFIDFVFDIKMINLGIGGTILAAIGVGIFLGSTLGLILKFHPKNFPWEYLQ